MLATALAAAALALALSRLATVLLFETGRGTPVSFLLACLIRLAVAGLAAWLPARRAARIDPVVALRYD